MERHVTTCIGSVLVLCLMVMPLVVGAPPEGRNFIANLSGDQEVPPNDTEASGVAHFRLSKDGSELTFRVNLENIENVTQAHIHLAPAGTNGPVAVWLYPRQPPAQPIPGPFEGRLAEGIITSDDMVGPLAGATLADLVTELRADNAYVNVHTQQMPPGEVRGQIRALGPR